MEGLESSTPGLQQGTTPVQETQNNERDEELDQACQKVQYQELWKIQGASLRACGYRTKNYSP